ncbi:MAG: nucleotidyltransferase family protein [Bacteroidales bacterium]|nr:nucleotidyltransferase family protein [Bacteroidales bacterium]
MRTKVFILAAGLGTRLKDLTADKPKALVLVNGKPMLEHLIVKLKAQGFNNFVINVHHFADKIEDFLKKNDNFNCNIQISEERDELLDTGGALLHAKSYLEDTENILIHNVDIFSDLNLKKLIDYHQQNNALATLAVYKRNSSRKLFFDGNMQLCKWKNKNTGEVKIARTTINDLSEFAFSGLHIVNSEIFNHITETGKFSIIDLYLRLAKTKKIIASESEYSYWFDLGKPETLSKAENMLKNMQL